MIRKRYYFWNKRTQLINQVRVFVDYSSSSTNRSSVALEMKDVSQGATDSLTIETSDTGNYSWTEGSDFDKTEKERTTAEAIVSAINSTSNFTAEAITGGAGNSFVYIHYTASGHIDSAYSSNVSAWACYEVNASNGTIRTIYDDSTGSTVKSQPFYSDRNGFVSFWIADGSGEYDIDPYKAGVPKDETYYSNYTP